MGSRTRPSSTAQVSKQLAGAVSCVSVDMPRCCCFKAVASRLRRSLLQLGDRVGRRVQRWPEGSWPDAMQRSPRRVRSTAKDVIKSTAQAAVGLGRRAARLGMESIKRASNR